MRNTSLRIALCLALAFTVSAAPPKHASKQSKGGASALHIPVDYYKLPNGLKVILSEDHTAPTAFIAVYYGIGFRIEPRDRTGFAHLFEHLMFEGSEHAPKGVLDKLILGNGGTNNGSTRFDFTNYYEVVPANVLETMLWLEADRMAALKLGPENLKNQQGVVGNEVKVNVLNQPYGGFPWIDMPMAANSNWYNSHNFYGDLTDIEAATVDDARNFYKTFYAPNNAAMAIVGDFDPAQAKKWIAKYFSSIPSAPQPPHPDLTEPPQDAEKRVTKEDALAQRPALAVGYHAPQRGTQEYYAMILLDQILGQGNDALLRKEIVKKRGYASGVSASLNFLGNQFDYNGPMEWTVSVIHDGNITPDQIIGAVDEVVEGVRSKPVAKDALELARTKVLSSLYDQYGALNGLGRADLLCSFALFDDDPNRINSIDADLARVTPDIVLKTAKEYLRPANRTIVVRTVKPKAAAPAASGK